MTSKPTTSDASNPAAAVTRNGTTASLGSAVRVGTPTRLDPAWRGVAASMARDDHRPTLPGRLAADNRPWLGVHPGRVGDADDRPLGREEPDDRLAPWLLTHRVQDLVAGADELVGCGLHAGHVGDVALDADLRHRQVRRPLLVPEARLRGLRERPHSKMLRAGYLLTVEVAVAALVGQRKPKRVDVQPTRPRGVGRDHGDARDELDLHPSSFLCFARVTG